MKIFRLFIGLLVTLLWLSSAWAEPNRIHPLFPLLDETGANVRDSGGTLDTKTTCGACHDTDFIQTHNDHVADHVQASCIQCHFEGGKLEWNAESFDEQGRLLREKLQLHSPLPENCGACHGLVRMGDKPLTLPDNFYTTGANPNDDPYSMTRRTGSVISSQMLDYSYMNLEGKQSAAHPWDIHAARMVTCTDCHHAANHPQKGGKKTNDLAHLRNDPRSLSHDKYLLRPDHRLETSTCTDCHDPFVTHHDLPYVERHMEKLACQSCHVADLRAPVLQSVDATLVDAEGLPRRTYRNATPKEGENPNAGYVTAFQPFLLPSAKDEGVLAPFNLVTHWTWIDEATGDPIPLKTLRAALWTGATLHPDLRATLDANGDGKIDAERQPLTDATARQAIENRLKSLGISKPTIHASLESHAIHHGVQGPPQVNLSCTQCHGKDSRLTRDIDLSPVVTASVLPIFPKGGDSHPTGTVVERKGKLTLEYPENLAGYYLLGRDRAAWSDSLGFLFFLLTVLGVMGHGGLRVYASRKYPTTHVETEKVYIYTAYERLWHWLMAASILLLVLTGFEIHYLGAFTLFGFSNAVFVHNFVAVVLIANAFLSLFYHLATTHIRQFIPKRENFIQDTLAQARYYMQGIFVGAPHPTEKTPERKLNPLQQMTYMMLLNVLFPFQVITGIVIWGISRWPELAESIGGLSYVTPLHNLGSWLLLSFVVAHVYLTTTGHTIFSNIHAMIDGYDELEAGAAREARR